MKGKELAVQVFYQPEGEEVEDLLRSSFKLFLKQELTRTEKTFLPVITESNRFKP